MPYAQHRFRVRFRGAQGLVGLLTMLQEDRALVEGWALVDDGYYEVQLVADREPTRARWTSFGLWPIPVR